MRCLPNGESVSIDGTHLGDVDINNDLIRLPYNINIILPLLYSVS